MMNGPTPRTDALGDQPMTIGDITPPFPVLAKWESLARQLEREVEALSAQVAELQANGPMVDGGIELDTVGDMRPAGKWRPRVIPMKQALHESEQVAEYEARRAEAAEAQVAELKKAIEPHYLHLKTMFADGCYMNEWEKKDLQALGQLFDAAKESGNDPS